MNSFSLALTVAGLVAASFLASPQACAESNPVVAAFSTGSGSVPVGITPGPDGNLWFTDADPSAPAIGRITPQGGLTEFPLSAGSSPGFIVVGPDANLWFTDANPSAPAIGRITTAGTVTKFTTGLVAGSVPRGITSAPDGNLWVADADASSPAIDRITPTGVITRFTNVGVCQAPFGITVGSDGNLWFTCPGSADVGVMNPITGVLSTVLTGGTAFGGVNGIALGPDNNIWVVANGNGPEAARITPAGVITHFPIAAPTNGSLTATRISAGPDGNLWFTGGQSGPIGRITTAGVSTLFSQGLPLFANPTAIQKAPDGNLWFVSAGIAGVPSFIGRFTLPSQVASTVPVVAAVLPGSRSVKFGTTATAFATIINASTTTAATNCSIQPATNLPAIFSFQTSDFMNNHIFGSIDTPFTIAAGGSQSFVIALTPFAATMNDVNGVPPDFGPTDLSLNFACDNATPTATIVGVNTLAFSASAVQPSDIIAIAATAAASSTVDIPGPPGTGAFAVATTNLGAAGAITVSPNLGGANLPVMLSVCQTVTATGICMAAPAPTLTTNVAANDTPSFGIFIQATGAVPFSPGINRVFVKFLDANGLVRGATSVAIRTR
ncbi:MAG TPA: hypothetical protein VM689_04015 [Aliidongia sp.]|nr:hypothetical protein [Aliidongia sp.]